MLKNLKRLFTMSKDQYTKEDELKDAIDNAQVEETQEAEKAQEVEEVVPEVVREQERLDEKEETYKTVDYEHLVSTLIGAMQEQQKQIDELKSQMAMYNAKSCKCKK